MTDLVDAYQRDDIHAYEKILQSNKDLLADPFIAENIDEVTRNMRTKAVLRLVAPYTRFTLLFISKQLKISLAEVQDIVSFLIVDRKLAGKINQHDGTVEITQTTDADRIAALQEWTSAVGALAKTVLFEGDGFRLDSESQYVGVPAGDAMVGVGAGSTRGLTDVLSSFTSGKGRGGKGSGFAAGKGGSSKHGGRLK